MNKFKIIALGIGNLIQILGVTMVILAMGNVLAGFYLPEKNSIGDAREKSPVYDHMPNKTEFWTDHKRAWTTHFEPYFHWRRDEYLGITTNVDTQGVRKTARQQDFQSNRKIFMLGGSTMWGTGVDDAHTVPSYLQKKYGNAFEIINYGESGYTSTQELNYLLYQLSNNDIPDVVVFYDGVNDGYAGVYSPAIPRDPENLRARFSKQKAEANEGFLIKIYKNSNYGKLVAHLTRKRGKKKYAEWDEKIKPDISNNATDVLGYYEANMRHARALAREYGFEVYFFWQPHLYSMTRKVNSYEQKIIDRASPVLVESQQALYELAKAQFSNRENEGLFFIGNVFDSVDEAIYIDWHHLGANGNAIIAEAIYLALLSQGVH